MKKCIPRYQSQDTTSGHKASIIIRWAPFKTQTETLEAVIVEYDGRENPVGFTGHSLHVLLAVVKM